MSSTDPVVTVSCAGVKAECMITREMLSIWIYSAKEESEYQEKQKTTPTEKSLMSPSLLAYLVSIQVCAAFLSDSSLIHLILVRETHNPNPAPPHMKYWAQLRKPISRLSLFPAWQRSRVPGTHSCSPIQPQSNSGTWAAEQELPKGLRDTKAGWSIRLHVCSAHQVLWATYFRNKQWNICFGGGLVWK